jgi:hypothetical protein
MQGAGEGFQKGQRLQIEREEAKLKAKMIDAQLKHMDAQSRAEDFRQKQAEEMRTNRQAAADMFMQEATGSKPGLRMVEEAGDPAIAPQQVMGQPGAPTPGRAPGLKDILTHQAIREGSAAQALTALRGQEHVPTTLEGLAVQRMIGGNQPEAEKILGMKPRTPMDLGNNRESIALQTFGQPTARLSPEQLAVVNKKAQEYEIQLAGTRAGDVAGARRDVQLQTQGEDILTPGEAGQLGVPYGTKRKQGFGKSPMTAQARNTIQAMGAAEAVLAQIENAALGELGSDKKTRTGGAITAQGPLGRALGAPGQLLGTLSQSNPAAVRLKNLGEGLLATFSRSVGNERGATTEQDVDRARKLIPSIYDTMPVATQKLLDMRDLITEIKSRAQIGASVMPGGAPSGGLPPPPPGWR